MKYHNFIASRPWYSSEYLTGPKYSGREQINLEGSLIIRNVTVRDLGIYVVVAVLPNSRRVRGFGRLRVYRPVSVPTLLVSNTTVTENEDGVVMKCYTDEIYIQCYESAAQEEDEAVPGPQNPDHRPCQEKGCWELPV
ncbi:Carcinoembryonic antigen-related cell adhesion molecule 21 [Myotis brandtii]|uniref:Carcinoembryonic antigen-related cell adhesion molecule 21 n=1 Tax=Myotis brandtii TaxID=109478 RepID=S7PB70_MYOBR|nr:Carcinoembryonic antigen-related cell adhesion molecule 21 [Myotis brandtii]